TTQTTTNTPTNLIRTQLQIIQSHAQSATLFVLSLSCRCVLPVLLPCLLLPTHPPPVLLLCLPVCRLPTCCPWCRYARCVGCALCHASLCYCPLAPATAIGSFR